MQTSMSPQLRRGMWILLFVATVFRLLLISDARFTGDESYFWATARNTATFDARPVYGPSMTDSPAYHPGPLFYYIMAIPQRLGASPLFGSFAIVLLHVFAGFLLFRATLLAASGRAALIALALFAFAPWDILYGDRIWLSCLAPVWGSFILYSALLARESQRAQTALLFFTLTCPQIHMSAPIVWCAAFVILWCRPPQTWSKKALLVGVMLTLVAYSFPLYHELTHDFTNTRAILTHAGGKISSDEALKHPLQMLLYAVFYGSSEIGYHSNLGYWQPFDAVKIYGSFAGLKTWFANQGVVLGLLTCLSILVSFAGWSLAIIYAVRHLVRAIRERSKAVLSTPDIMTIALIAALFAAAALLFMARKGFFPHYANLLVPMIFLPMAAGADALMNRYNTKFLRYTVLGVVVGSVLSMAVNTWNYYKTVDTLNGVSVTREIVADVMAENAPVSVRFEGFQNLFAWKMIAQTEHKKALNVQNSANISYVIKNRRIHTGAVPANGRLYGRVLVLRTQR